MSPRPVKEWIGHRPESMPPKTVFDRLWATQGGKDAITGIPFGPQDKVARDHIVPLIDGGENREFNLQLITVGTHALKTAMEAGRRAKERSVRAKARGYSRQRPKLQGAGFPPATPQHTATRKIEKWFGFGANRSSGDREPAK